MFVHGVSPQVPHEVPTNLQKLKGYRIEGLRWMMIYDGPWSTITTFITITMMNCVVAKHIKGTSIMAADKAK